MNIVSEKHQPMDHASFREVFPVWLGEIRENLLKQGQRWAKQGLPTIACEGKLLRPFVGFCVAGAMDPALLEDERFWDVMLAIQMVHEASLLHDDIIDEASVRRGRPTALAKHGTAAALVAGDHLLTAAYRLIAKAENPALFSRFCEAVEQTVAGELAQAKSCGGTITPLAYNDMIAQKSGALFGFSLAIAPLLLGDEVAVPMWDCGVRLGCLYQRLDDLLDYCTHGDTGKPMLQDFHQQKPTWPWLALFPEGTASTWELSGEAVHNALFVAESERAGSHSMAEELCIEFASLGEQLFDDIARHISSPIGPLSGLIADWTMRAEVSIAAEREAGAAFDASAQMVSPFGAGSLETVRTKLTPTEAAERLRGLMAEEGLADPARWPAYFAENSRSFSFAARWFPPVAREQIAGIYAYCRCTDEIADGFGDLANDERFALLDAWEAMTIEAYKGQSTSIPLLDRVMPEMAKHQVPIHTALDLIEGMRIDLRGDTIEDMEQLLHYCYCAASTVGLWCTHMFANVEPWVLERADALGKAMQLTNILRDVGEDLAAGRVYIPESLLREHQLTTAQLWEMRRGDAPISESYIALIESLLQEAELLYKEAFAGMTALPTFFAHPVAVAAEVYRGIHREIRRNGYNNLTKRAYTSTFRKLFLAPIGLWKLRRARQQTKLLVQSQTGGIVALPPVSDSAGSGSFRAQSHLVHNPQHPES